MTALVIIPSRYGSSRFPGKPLARIGGKPMIQRVYESASRAQGLERVLVATDDRRILVAVKSFGGEAVLTSKDHQSGTDRLAEVMRRLKAEWVINVQGDLPFIRPETISRTLSPLRRNSSIMMSTARTPILSYEEWMNPNVVKVVTDARGFALYFSRSPIPFQRSDSNGNGRSQWAHGYRHVGIYAYRRDFLLKFARLKPTVLERTEKLEQLRALDHGYRIRVVDVDEPRVEVDAPEDIEKAEKYLSNRQSTGSNRERGIWQA